MWRRYAFTLVLSRLAKDQLIAAGNKDTLVATVINFPHGCNSLEEVKEHTRFALEQGADEIDLVIPYEGFIAGDSESVKAVVNACKTVIENTSSTLRKYVKLKVIIESGVLETQPLISKATELVIESGADMVKTSTGKVAVNATLEAAETILRVIKQTNSSDVGFKAAGGIRSLHDALSYTTLAKRIMGEDWVTPEHFRFGASGLLDDVLAKLSGKNVCKTSNY